MKNINCCELVKIFHSIFQKELKGKRAKDYSLVAHAFNKISYLTLFRLNENEQLCSTCSDWLKCLNMMVNEVL